MATQDVRKTVLTPRETDRRITEHLFKLNQKRPGLRRVSFSKYALEAILERLEREARG